MVLTIPAIFGSYFYGHLVDRIGAKRSLRITLWIWVALLLAMMSVTTKNAFWFVGLAIGLNFGGVNAIERPLLLSLIPDVEAGRYFSLMLLSARVAAVIGPLLWGLTTWALEGPIGTSLAYRAAVFVVALMFVISIWILRRSLIATHSGCERRNAVRAPEEHRRDRAAVVLSAHRRRRTRAGCRATRPLLLVVNHPNALVDALLVGWAMPRRVVLTAKATLFARSVRSRALLAWVGVVPLVRSSDVRASASGRDRSTSQRTVVRRAAQRASSRWRRRHLSRGYFARQPVARSSSGRARHASHSKHATRAAYTGLRSSRSASLSSARRRRARESSFRLAEPIVLDRWTISGDSAVAALTEEIDDAVTRGHAELRYSG